ncbi:acetylhydrolase [Paenibacillus sp. FSL R7-0273]|uniref:alpha/beta hydrolase family protein n=1 Tax=Paenibacillus sp. FSL R7-0273 TaxID=1536772 RepID=UPI0004F5F543|nr:acetylhydrolase [Paenibacillus sp. FSL R7-0273]AIQ48096.1 acetylhydrolase [Paenibacillus sp. FSL R7-0273]OMF85184.1 alpha/beta hydrolase [Paenibacillus sp. FSL R7-0273]
MEFVLFTAALIVEIAMAVYCMVTKQKHRKLKSLVRIAEFIVLATLILLPVIEWSFYWIVCTGLLFLLAVRGVFSLIRQSKADLRVFKRSTTLVKAILLLIMLTLAFTPVLLFPQYRLPEVTGDYPVATAVYTYTDKSRIEQFTDTGEHRQVNVEFWYPEQAEGNYPLLVFSHGAYGIRYSNTSTFTELASHGYVVASIDHPYHSFYTESEDGKLTMISPDYFQEVNDTNKAGVYTAQELDGIIQKWMKLRTGDMGLVIDTVVEMAAKDDSPAVYQLVDPAKIGVFGHSMGGAASVWLGRERDDIGAVVNLDGPLFSELIYDRASDNFAAANKAYTTPLLNVYSDDVWKQLDYVTVYAGNKTAEQTFAEVYSVHFQGANHMSLTDLPLFSPILANMMPVGKSVIDKYYCIENMNQLVLQFYDYTLKGIGGFTPKETY